MIESITAAALAATIAAGAPAAGQAIDQQPVDSMTDGARIELVQTQDGQFGGRSFIPDLQAGPQENASYSFNWNQQQGQGQNQSATWNQQPAQQGQQPETQPAGMQQPGGQQEGGTWNRQPNAQQQTDQQQGQPNQWQAGQQLPSEQPGGQQQPGGQPSDEWRQNQPQQQSDWQAPGSGSAGAPSTPDASNTPETGTPTDSAESPSNENRATEPTAEETPSVDKTGSESGSADSTTTDSSAPEADATDTAATETPSSAISEAATTLTFASDGVTATGETDGYKISGTDLTINEAGTYLITGACEDGSITVKKGTTNVVLVLQDLILANSNGATLTCNKSTDVTLKVVGIVKLIDAENPDDENSTDEAVADAFEGAAIKVKSGAKLLITGTGTLTADGSAVKNGIKGASEATVTIGADASDAITVVANAAKNGVASDGVVTMNGGTLIVSASNDGIKSEPDEDDDTSAGAIVINGGKVYVTAGNDGIQATNLVKVNGGAISIDAADDAIHSDAEVSILGGTIDIAAGDDAVHADELLNVGALDADGPTITVSKSYEGLEAAIVNVYSGTVDITSSDDGINAANKDLASSYAFALNIFGGTVRVNADGDGLDSNGAITIAGGNLEIFGAANNGNAAMDYGDTCGSWTQTGGSIIAVGMSGMATVPTSGTYVSFGATGMGGGMGGQPGGMMGGDQTGNQFGGFSQNQAASTGNVSISADSSVVIKDSAGNVVYSTTGVKSANSVVFSSEDLVSGETYTLYVNGSAVATSTATTGNGQATGGMGGMMGDQPGQQMTQPTQQGQSAQQQQPAQFGQTPRQQQTQNQWRMPQMF